MGIYEHFEKIAAIPHTSGDTKAISNMIVSFAKEHGLVYYQDELGNVIVYKKASPSYESAPTVILQGHMDMVGEKDENIAFDFTKDGLKLVKNKREDNGSVKEYLSAKGTTLGADDGVALAYMLTILEDDSIAAPALECVFTVDEEVGMLGASFLDMTRLKGRIMINLDQGVEGDFLAGCAGGATAICSLPIKRESSANKSLITKKLEIGGLTGGHSGEDIIYGRGNANVLLGRVLFSLQENFDYKLFDINGGLKDNAIPRSCAAIIAINKNDEAAVMDFVEEIDGVLKAEYNNTDPDIFTRLCSIDTELCPLEDDSAKKAIAALYNLPAGIQKMSYDFEGLVQTSLNMGILKTDREEITYSFSVRSSVRSEKEELKHRIKCLMEALGGSVVFCGEYPAWEYKEGSKLLQLMKDTYYELFKKEAKAGTIHAGLECGLFAETLFGLDCVSIGPNLKDIHTTREELDLESFERCFILLTSVIERIK